MLSVVANLPVVDIDDRFYNLIPSRFPTIKVYARIAGGRDDEFAAIEELTNPRVREKFRLTQGRASVDQSQVRFQNWNHAPFAYPNPEGSQFYGSERNVLELAGDLQTALAISVAKRETFLLRTTEPPTALEMRALGRRVVGRFADIRGDGEARDAPHRFELGNRIVEAGLDGILFNPIERPTGTGIVILHPEKLGKADQGEHFKFVWDGSKISELYAFATGTAYEPGKLSLSDPILAA